MGKGQFFQQMILGNLDRHMQKNESPKLPCTEINSKCIKDLNVRPKMIELLEVNIGQKCHNTGFGNDVLNMTPKAQATKRKNRQIGLDKNRKFYWVP